MSTKLVGTIWNLIGQIILPAFNLSSHTHSAQLQFLQCKSCTLNICNSAFKTCLSNESNFDNKLQIMFLYFAKRLISSEVDQIFYWQVMQGGLEGEA